MGNYSRDTFRPDKNYVGVRLQQGVPLVDADWNEQNDVIREDFYTGLNAICPDGVTRLPSPMRFSAFSIFPTVSANDFYFAGGTAIIGGRPAHLPARPFTYSAQPWTDAAKAAHDGVAVIPALTTPSADSSRTDLAYLDVWEREVGQTEDADIVNPVIGVETAVRIRREVAVRVVEGSITLPEAPVGHRFIPLAAFNRAAGNAIIQQGEIEERRSFIDTSPAIRCLSIVPSYLPITDDGWSAWQNNLSSGFPSGAHKPASISAIGQIPLCIPDGAKLLFYEIKGQTSGSMSGFPDGLFHALYRVRTDRYVNSSGGPLQWTLASEGIISIGTYWRRLAILPASENLHIVDNYQYAYFLYAYASGSGLDVMIDGVTIIYEL